jgi:hypothetical protein
MIPIQTGEQKLRWVQYNIRGSGGKVQHCTKLSIAFIGKEGSQFQWLGLILLQLCIILGIMDEG